jgi:hypothetical protein
MVYERGCAEQIFNIQISNSGYIQLRCGNSRTIATLQHPTGNPVQTYSKVNFLRHPRGTRPSMMDADYFPPSMADDLPESEYCALSNKNISDIA